MNWIASSDKEIAIVPFRADRDVDAARTSRWFLEACFAMQRASREYSADAALRARDHSAFLLRRKRQHPANRLLNNSDTALRERARRVCEARPQLHRRASETGTQVAAAPCQFDVLLGVDLFN